MPETPGNNSRIESGLPLSQGHDIESSDVAPLLSGVNVYAGPSIASAATRLGCSNVDAWHAHGVRDQIRIAPHPALPCLNCAGISAAVA